MAPSVLLLPTATGFLFSSPRSDRSVHPLLRNPFVAPLEVGTSFNGAALRGSGFSRNTKRESPSAPPWWRARCCGPAASACSTPSSRPASPDPPSSPLSPSGSGVRSDDLGFSKWLEGWRGGSEDKEAVDRRKLVSKWHPTTKGTLKRSYRVPSKTEGKRLLKAIASLLSDDDQFIDATSHKGCQIRRESAHGESVCCNNVRALFDELPTPHLVLEITPFPAGPLADKDYAKAEKLEKVLRSGSSI